MRIRFYGSFCLKPVTNYMLPNDDPGTSSPRCSYKQVVSVRIDPGIGPPLVANVDDPDLMQIRQTV